MGRKTIINSTWVDGIFYYYRIDYITQKVKTIRYATEDLSEYDACIFVEDGHMKVSWPRMLKTEDYGVACDFRFNTAYRHTMYHLKTLATSNFSEKKTVAKGCKLTEADAQEFENFARRTGIPFSTLIERSIRHCIDNNVF